MAKKKNGELSYSVANKKKIAKAIVSSIRSLKQEQDSSPTPPAQKQKPSKYETVDASQLGGAKRMGDMSYQEMMELTGMSVGDLKKADVSQDTKEDVDEKREQNTGRTTDFDRAMASESLPDTDVSEFIKNRTGKNKSKSIRRQTL